MQGPDLDFSNVGIPPIIQIVFVDGNPYFWN